jgi:hypothetical protein
MDSDRPLGQDYSFTLSEVYAEREISRSEMSASLRKEVHSRRTANWLTRCTSESYDGRMSQETQHPDIYKILMSTAAADGIERGTLQSRHSALLHTT